MLGENAWFERLASVPGVRYPGSQRVNRARLWGVGAKPKVTDYGSEYGPSHIWPQQGGGETSASPAGQARTDDWKGSSDEILFRLEEILELPGYATDYHFAMQGCCEELWKRRVKEPKLYHHLEGLWKLNIDLVRAIPGAFEFGEGDEKRFIPVMYAFRRLYTLYFREGFTREALEVAKLCADFGQGEDALAQITAIAEAEAGAKAK